MPSKTTANVTAEDDDAPRDLDDLLQRLQRRLAASEPERWTRCTSRACRRVRRCADAAMRCVPQTPPCATSPEEEAQMRAELQQMLSARMRTLP